MAQSRVEAILKAAGSSDTYHGRPLSRVEALLMGLDAHIDESAAGGGSSGSGSAPSEEDGQDFEDSDIDDIMSVISTEND